MVRKSESSTKNWTTTPEVGTTSLPKGDQAHNIWPPLDFGSKPSLNKNDKRLPGSLPPQESQRLVSRSRKGAMKSEEGRTQE
jgi:hypothetical protein